MTTPSPPLAHVEEIGRLGVCHLKRYWSTALMRRAGALIERRDERYLDYVLLSGLGLGLHQSLEYLYARAPTFAEFEDWVETTVGTPSPGVVGRMRADMLGTPQPGAARRELAAIEAMSPVFDANDLAHWEREGYVVLRNAVSADAAAAAERAIWAFIGADPGDARTWYRTRAQGIMVNFIQHPALHANRHAPRIKKAFAQLYGTPDLWPTADRCGFHPPQTPEFDFPGPDLHWDVEFDRPIRNRTQGVLYLTDTPAEQGATTLVPGFHHRLDAWLRALPEGADPQAQDLHALGTRAVGAGGGDLVIWHHALPHGARPNLGARPRIVQYINMLPGWRGGVALP